MVEIYRLITDVSWGAWEAGEKAGRSLRNAFCDEPHLAWCKFVRRASQAPIVQRAGDAVIGIFSMHDKKVEFSFSISQNALLAAKVGGGLFLFSVLLEKVLFLYTAFVK